MGVGQSFFMQCALLLLSSNTHVREVAGTNLSNQTKEGIEECPLEWNNPEWNGRNELIIINAMAQRCG